MKIETTQRETAAIFALVAGIVDNWKDAYIIAYNGNTESVEKQKSLAASVSRWRHSAVVTNEFERLTQLYAQLTQNNTNSTKQAETAKKEDKQTDTGDNVRTDGKKTPLIDFSKPENQTAKLNELINTATDGGEALDALKVIIQSQRADREAAKDGKVVRAYLPITCAGCPLYKLQVKKHGKEL